MAIAYSFTQCGVFSSRSGGLSAYPEEARAVTALVLGNQGGRKTAVSVAGNIQSQRVIAGQNRLTAFAITLPGLILWALRARRIA